MLPCCTEIALPCPAKQLMQVCSYRQTKIKLGARTLLGAPGRTIRNKKLLGAKGIVTILGFWWVQSMTSGSAAILVRSVAKTVRFLPR